MPIYIGQSTTDLKAIALGTKQMSRVYVGSRLVWQKRIAPVFTPIKYGALYNWYAATDARNICPDGWHIPTLDEIVAMELYIEPSAYGISNTVGVKLKDTGETHWLPTNNSINQYGFNAKGSSSRSYGGAFNPIKSSFAMWSSTPRYSTYAHSVAISSGSDYLMITQGNSTTSDRYKSGLSLRPVKNSTTLTHGQSGVYIGNDGKAYRTICIGTQEWLADNLCETKYRNGDIIPIVTENAAWTALTTGAMCYYNNDINNAIMP